MAAPRLVLVVDQFEELFTAGGETQADLAEREAFIAALHAMATVPVGPSGAPSALVLVAVRGDFVERAIAYPPLATAVDTGPFTVGPMSEAELRQAITGPAAEAGLAVEPALVDAVITELRGEGAEGGLGSGVLPLLSQAMAVTWERREGDKLTVRAYRRTGGVADAVNRSAQAAYDTLTSGQRDAARFVFTRLTVTTPDGQLERRRCSRADLNTPVAEAPSGIDAGYIDAVIDVFSARRLLSLGGDSVEISHDVLLRAWKQLQDWLGDDQLDRALYSQVITDARTWDTSGREPSYLYRPGRLAAIATAAARWANTPTRYPPLPPTSTAFLRAAHSAAHRAVRRRRGVIAGLVALTLTTSASAVIAAHNAANATRQHAIALSRQLAAESLTVDAASPGTARRLAIAAWRVSPTSQATSVITTLLNEQQQDSMLFAGTSFYADAVAFSPNGKLLASTDNDGTVRLWDPATGQPVGAPLRVTSRPNRLLGLAFSPDGNMLATASGDGTVRLWDPATGHPAGAPLRATSGVEGVAFSPDGKLLASANLDGTVRLWDPVTSQPVGAPLRATRHAGGVWGVAFSPDGNLLASADSDGTVRLWDPATGHPVGAPLRADPGGQAVYGVAFSPDGNLLASADLDGTVRLWDPATGHPVGAPLRATSGADAMNAVAFSPDGKLLASADDDGTVRLWDPATGHPVGAPLRATSAMGGVAFSPDSKLLATADFGGTVQLWDPAVEQPVGVALEHATSYSGGVPAVAFSPDGTLLASASASGAGIVRLWDPVSGQPVGAPFRAGPGAKWTR